MIEHPKDKEFALDIVWGIIRNENERWRLVFPGVLGCQVRDVVKETGWSDGKCRALMEELVARGQLIKKWNHQHQSYWSGHYSTLNEHARGGNPEDEAISEIPF